MSKSFKEEIALIFISFWLTILFWRGLIFKDFPNWRVNSIISIGDFHIHHFLIGFLVLLISGCYLLQGKRNLLSLLFFGVGLGMIFDEFTFWFKFQFDYWSIGNFWAILSFGLFLLVLYFLPARKSNFSFFPVKTFHKNPQNPFISVVIPAFNEEKFLARTLQSILDQDWQNFELIVVDNNSSDNTSKIAKSFGAKVIFESKQGVAFARQKGFSAARGKIIATTDADTILPKNWLSRIVEEFEKDKDLVAFGGLFTLSSGPISARIAVRFLAYPILILDKFFSGGWSLSGANLAIKKEAFLKVGGFKTELGFGEDVDISQRLKKIGKIKLFPDFLVQTSGRRYKNGLIYALLSYGLNNILRLLFKKYKFARLSPIRVEESLFTKLSFAILSFLMILPFSLIYFSQVKDLKPIKEKIVLAQEEIREQGREFKNSLINFEKTKLRSIVPDSIESKNTRF